MTNEELKNKFEPITRGGYKKEIWKQSGDFIFGSVLNRGGERLVMWYISGNFYTNDPHDYDLIPKKETEKPDNSLSEQEINDIINQAESQKKHYGKTEKQDDNLTDKEKLDFLYNHTVEVISGVQKRLTKAEELLNEKRSEFKRRIKALEKEVFKKTVIGDKVVSAPPKTKTLWIGVAKTDRKSGDYHYHDTTCAYYEKDKAMQYCDKDDDFIIPIQIPIGEEK